MNVLPLFVLLGALMAVDCERHSLTYIYTALSKKVKNPGIHDFTAMGLLDTKMIDYFDSDNPVKVPKQSWMKEKLNEEYWKKGTDSRKSKQQWFKVNLDILKERMNQTDTDLHVLQWMHGCEADFHPDREPRFERGIDMYSYDGNSFLYFDDAHGVWVAATEAANPTKRKWDEVQVLKDYTKGYLEKECLDWLKKFMDYGKQELKNHSPPDVYIFASPTKHEHSVQLTCMATGFYPPDIVLRLKRNNDVLTPEKDKVMTTGIRPNQDDTYQRRDHIIIFRLDKGNYSCEVIHAATGVNLTKYWDGKLPKHMGGEIVEVGPDGVNVGIVVGAVIAGIVVIALIIIGVLLYKKLKDRKEKERETSSGSVSLESRDTEKPLMSASARDSSNNGSSDSVSKSSDKDSHKSSDSAIGSTGSSDTADVNTTLMHTATSDSTETV